MSARGGSRASRAQADAGGLGKEQERHRGQARAGPAGGPPDSAAAVRKEGVSCQEEPPVGGAGRGTERGQVCCYHWAAKQRCHGGRALGGMGSLEMGRDGAWAPRPDTWVLRPGGSSELQEGSSGPGVTWTEKLLGGSRWHVVSAGLGRMRGGRTRTWLCCDVTGVLGAVLATVLSEALPSRSAQRAGARGGGLVRGPHWAEHRHGPAPGRGAGRPGPAPGAPLCLVNTFSPGPAHSRQGA